MLIRYGASSMSIDALDVTRYPRDRGPYTTETIVQPSWYVVERELRSMHNWEKPILWLHQDREVGDSTCLAINGGCGIYHARPAVCREFPTTTRCAYFDLYKFELEQQDDPDTLPIVQITFRNSKNGKKK